MYSDKDGQASKKSQAEYDARIRVLLFTTSLFSLFGFSASILNEKSNGNASPPFQDHFQRRNYSLWALASLNSLSLFWKNGPIETYNSGLRGAFLCALVAVSIVSPYGTPQNNPLWGFSPASLQLYTAIFLAIVQTLFPRRPDLFTPEGNLVDCERSSSASARYSMQWCRVALTIAGRSSSLDELPALDHLAKSQSQPLLLIQSHATNVWNSVLKQRYTGFVKQWALMLLGSLITFGSPYCVMRLLKSLEANKDQSNEAWIWLFAIGASSTCQTIVSHHLMWIQWSKMGVPVRAQLIMAIFQKALRRKDSKDPNEASQPQAKTNTSEPVNLITSDTLSFAKFTAINHNIPSSFVKFIFAVLFLLKLLGWKSTLAGILTTIFCIPVYTLVIKQQRSAQKGLKTARDRKIKAVTEALLALRQIKFSATEAEWEEHIETFRQEEIYHLKRSYTARSVRSVWSITAPFLVAAASICTYAYLEGVISPSIIFPMIEVLPHLQGALGLVPVIFQDFFAARLNAQRMDNFLMQPEQEKVLTASSSSRVSFRSATIAWPSDGASLEEKNKFPNASSLRFSLKNINVDFPVGELSIICGRTGSGKSLLLSAIIGEVDLLHGRIQTPSGSQGSAVAFVSQTPWLQNTTIRDNILFGSSFDKDRYEKVLTACALRPDLSTLANGDETQIGLRGVKLSGGQRARVAFARALYSKSQLIVLDDIFSALDSHVSKEIFEALTGDLGEGRTRILVTHHVSLCMSKAKYIFQLDSNAIKYAGARELSEIAAKRMEAATLINSPPQQHTSKSISDLSEKKKHMKRPPIKKSNSRGDLNVYTNYFAAAGGFTFTLVYITSLLAKHFLSALTSWLLGHVDTKKHGLVIEDIGAIPSEKHQGGGFTRYLYFYLWTSALAMTLEFVSNMHKFSGSLRASGTLFRNSTHNAMRMPLHWLDSVPVGEVLTVFTVSARMVDDTVLVRMSEFAEQVVKLLTMVSIGLQKSAYTTFLTVALIVWCIQVSRGYLRARSMIKRAEHKSTADILEHFTSSAAGVSTIRAFGAVQTSINLMHRHLDNLSTAKRHFWIFNRWLSLQMSFIGIIFSVGTGMILLSTEAIIDPSLVGFTLTFSMGISRAIYKAVNTFGALETEMDAVGAMVRYATLKTEDQGGADAPEDWPSQGRVEVKGLEARYSENLPPVLNGVTFATAPGQRVGIVGRTGAGKSSLTLSLLRFLEPQSGNIHIDGIDISTLKLKDLRSRVGFIPQDPLLFSGTVRSNLDPSKQYPEHVLRNALSRVKLLAGKEGARSDLYTLDSPISAGGANMSQGQRQLLCLARVLIKNPKILILDEATSAIDKATDLLIQESIKNDYSGTLIVVAHRLSTIARFDQVLVINDGMVAESGKPRDLLIQRGLFYNLVRDSQDIESLTAMILQ